MIKNQKGFAPVEVLLVLIVIGLIGGIGWYVYGKQQKKGTPKQVTITNFEECKAAGNPIMESYPEQCSADGKTFTNSGQQAKKPAAEEGSWLSYEPANKSYSVRVPDGWSLIELDNNLYGRDYEKLAYKAGERASVEVLKEGGWDGASPFALYYPEPDSEPFVPEGTLVDSFVTNSELKVKKYVYVQEIAPDGIGYQKGDKAYTYCFDKAGKNIVISHVVSLGQKDQSALVERMVKTLTVN